MSLGKRIAELRDVKGWSQSDLAVFLGVTKSTVAHWEHDRRSPRARRLQAIAKLLDTTIGGLYGEGSSS